jgi:isochorismate synthase EntC
MAIVTAFVFEPRPFHTFLGATPELLAKVDGRTLTTMALAGSIRRSPTHWKTPPWGSS